jgi:hypothetical protein
MKRVKSAHAMQGHYRDPRGVFSADGFIVGLGVRAFVLAERVSLRVPVTGKIDSAFAFASADDSRLHGQRVERVCEFRQFHQSFGQRHAPRGAIRRRYSLFDPNYCRAYFSNRKLPSSKADGGT